MVAETLLEVGGEPVIDRAAIGVVGVHVAERNAAGQAVGGRIARRAKSSLLHHCQRSVDASLRGRTDQGVRDGRIQAAGPKEVR